MMHVAPPWFSSSSARRRRAASAAGALLLALCACGGKPSSPGGSGGSTQPAVAGAMATSAAGAGGAGTPAAGSTAGVAGTGTSTAPAAPAQAGMGGGTPAVRAGANAMPVTPVAGSGGSSVPSQPMAAGFRCKQRPVAAGETRLRMHHIHFNTQDPEANLAFVQKFFAAKPIDFCTDEASSRTTRAAKTERAYFLYTKTSAPPSNMRLNRLAHVGYNHPDVAGELDRLLELDVPLADASACATAAQGTPCNTFNVLWFYIDTPESARFEIATGPGPSTSGFSHIHLVAPTYSFYEKVLGEALQNAAGTRHVDGVNMIDSGRTGMLDTTIMYQETRGAAVDHVAFSTTNLDATLERIRAAGIEIADPVSFKPEFGFRSFMVKSPEGVWLEIVEDSAFAP